ncbi:MAG: integrating conjugative element protein [Azoarcus sp.]|jgi:integrating conjugative element protein (TIGR03765 family)|nr:integrating conjugative element protein [Azoarcus sp.]
MKRALFATIGLFSATAIAGEALIVVEDLGGVSALPYYQRLNPPNAGSAKPSVPAPRPRAGRPTEAEALMLPVRSALLSPGEAPRRVLHAPGLTPLFLIGDDERSRRWLQQRQATLQEMRAAGQVVNVTSPEALAALRRLVPGLTLSPVSGDDLARRLGIRHYPALITAAGIEP